MKTYKFDLYTYDVWGNDKDGYEVNDIYLQEHDICIDEEIVFGRDKELIQALKRINIIHKTSKTSKWGITGDPDLSLYFDYCGKPVFELRNTEIYDFTEE